MRVRDVMTNDVCSVSPETPLNEVARLLVERRVSGVPVVDADGRVLGVVSEGDFLAREANAGDRPKGPLWWHWAASPDQTARRLKATTAGAAMSAPPITVAADRPLMEAATIMARSSINRLPVVADGKLVGIVSRADVVRAFARTDEELLEVARRSLRAVDGLRVVSVRDGTAVLAGSVASETLAKTARHIVEAIEGILSVDATEVSWYPSAETAESWVDSDTEAAARLR